MSVDRARLTSTFIELARIDSITFHEKEIVDYLGNELSDLGLRTYVDAAGHKIGGTSGNLIAHLAGDSSKPAIFFNCHVDTVEPGIGVKPVEQDGMISAAGDTILGADDKAGVAVLLEVARVLTAGTSGHGSIDLIFTVAEEKGLLGAKNLDWSLVTGEYGFVFDAAGPVGDITVKTPSQDTIEAVFRGRAAHAGVNPEEGVSAVRAAAKAIAAMSLGRIDSETTANIGIIEGGRAINIVPEKCAIKGEARSLTPAQLGRQTQSMIDAARDAAEEDGVKVEIEVTREYDGFQLAADDQVVSWAISAFKLLGLTPSLVATGGGSDTNIFNARNVPTVNLGAGYLAPHTVDESIAVDDLERVARVALAIVETVAAH